MQSMSGPPEAMLLGLWFEWGDSNARFLDPEEYRELFYNILWAFIDISLRLICFLELSVHRFSVCSSPNCGRICGQNASWAGVMKITSDREAFCVSG